jgi:hypothetical protein
MSLLPTSRYDEIREAVADLLEDFGIVEYPIDVFAIVRSMGIKLIPYSSLDPGTNALMMAAYPDAVTRRPKRPDVQRTTIFFNDVNRPRTRIRFSVAHELGHLYLDTENETEADNFARDFLAPQPLVLEYSSTSTTDGRICISEEQVMSDFNVSYGCACTVVDRAIGRIRSGRPMLGYERRISVQCHVQSKTNKTAAVW